VFGAGQLSSIFIYEFAESKRKKIKLVKGHFLILFLKPFLVVLIFLYRAARLNSVLYRFIFIMTFGVIPNSQIFLFFPIIFSY
jgi:hypothetical protein